MKDVENALNREQSVLRYLLDHHAEETPDAPHVCRLRN